MVRSHEAAAAFAERFVELLGARPEDGAAALMTARPAELGKALEDLIRRGMTDMPGAFPVGPRTAPTTSGGTGRGHG